MSFYEGLHFLQENVKARKLQRFHNRMRLRAIQFNLNSTYGKFGKMSTNRHDPTVINELFKELFELRQQTKNPL